MFDKRCADASVLNRFETNPPAGLYGAPPGRQKSVIKNPETLRKLSTDGAGKLVLVSIAENSL